MDPKTRRLFSGGRGPQFLIMMDADNGKVLQSYPISAGVDANTFDPGTGLLFDLTDAGGDAAYLPRGFGPISSAKWSR